MKRKYLIGLGLAAGAAGAVALNRQQIGTAVARVSGQAAAPPAKQWPFDGQELRTLMDRVVDDQRTLVANAETPDARARAEAFRRYYEGRRAAVK
jgi:hypothetical protein